VQAQLAAQGRWPGDGVLALPADQIAAYRNLAASLPV